MNALSSRLEARAGARSGPAIGQGRAHAKPRKRLFEGLGSGRVASSAGGTVWRKAGVAVSGVLLWGWSGLHLIGVSSAYAGADVMERYAAWLRQGAGVPLWGMRLALGAVCLLHVWLVLGLWARARRARPIGYGVTNATGALYGIAQVRGVRWLRWGSVLLLAGIVAHVLHFAFGVGLPGFDTRHVYSNLIGAFRSSAGLTLAYVAFAGLFGFHLGHGLFAAPVSLGAAWTERRRRTLGWALGLTMALGYAALPVAVWHGVLQ